MSTGSANLTASPGAAAEAPDAAQLAGLTVAALGAAVEDGAYGLPQVPASLAQNVLGTWEWGDFFEPSPAGEVNLKKLIAKKCGFRYGGVNNNDPSQFQFASAFAGIPAYTPELFVEARDKFKAALASGNAARIVDASSVSVVVSGCLIRWKPLVAVNEGYVREWADKNLQHWDSSIERRAAPSADDPAYMHFTTTGASSLLALIAQTVYEFKTTGGSL